MRFQFPKGLKLIPSMLQVSFLWPLLPIITFPVCLSRSVSFYYALLMYCILTAANVNSLSTFAMHSIMYKLVFSTLPYRSNLMYICQITHCVSFTRG
ncbi:hypothetical protein GDO86_004358 [Hymenochirus boettgeri]|uniref:Uncharacterized protein n=1 Tax=Hymenochirus boettgeri TaxID=247094 RepID=A0A8T2KA96_9PIPI|nr:hypothetical protein GDO86_004358 [Hymenochirus boettgeri]